MIRKSTRGFMVVVALFGAGWPELAEAQVTGKESVPGGVEAKPSMPQMERAPAAAPIMPPRAQIMATPPVAAPGHAPGAVPAAKVAPSEKAAPATPPKDAKGKSNKKKSSKNGYGAAAPASKSIGGGADERRPGRVERAPGQPQ